MQRRSIRLMTTSGSYAENTHNDSIGSNRPTRQRSAQSTSHVSTPRRPNSRAVIVQDQSSSNSQDSNTSVVSSVLDASSIQEQTQVNSMWGLDDDEVIKDGDTTVIQSNGEFNSAETQTTMINGYTCSDCSILSDRNDSITAFSAFNSTSGKVHAASGFKHTCANTQTSTLNTQAASASMQTASTKVYSRDRNQKHRSREIPFYTHKTMLLFKNTALTFATLVVSLFHTVMLKLGCDPKAYLNYCGSVNVRDYLKEDGHLRINGKSLCDDCKGTQHLETHTTVHMQSSWARGLKGILWHTLCCTGYLLMQAVQSIGTAGWFVSQKILSFLWLAIVSPGKATSGLFWWLGTGWYQLTALISLLNIFVLTRCLPKILKMLLLLLFPLLLFLGLYLWGSEYFWLPAFSSLRKIPSYSVEDTAPSLKPHPESSISTPSTKEGTLQFDFNHLKELEKQFVLMGSKQSQHVEEYEKMKFLVLKIQEQVEEMNDKSHISTVITNLLQQHFGKHLMEKKEPPMVDSRVTISNHETRIKKLEALFAKLSEAIEEDRKVAQSRASGGEIDDPSVLRKRIASLEEDFENYKASYLRQSAQSSCDLPDCVLQKVDAKLKNQSMRCLPNQKLIPEPLLRWLSTNYISNAEFNSRLLELEAIILKNITHHVSVTKHMPSAKVVETAVLGEISGITKEEAQVIVNNALKLYSQDRTGMADFALESGGGSILGTRCSETYGTKTALMSLFGIPLWYFSQSPRVVIQEENEKAFQIVELRIFSNWGHPDFTCLYRFRAHGTPVK
ncbi:hypothetical protein GDO86_017355 [Hymenochirus boettgeri]|uniref:SUN domain-containing protein n=1 Tax=Hymenochirus boettgeri TaxID=247094 RepID=A0A8T2IN77_9PIPI|nr:hypothetical protein GDO86_017355 [Hymenochirus boettgeri]